jgi:hypothetical protein
MTINEIGTNLLYAAVPTVARAKKTIKISCVAYAVEEIASLAKTGSATFFDNRWWESSELAIGAPMKNRFSELEFCLVVGICV